MHMQASAGSYYRGGPSAAYETSGDHFTAVHVALARLAAASRVELATARGTIPSDFQDSHPVAFYGRRRASSVQQSVQLSLRKLARCNAMSRGARAEHGLERPEDNRMALPQVVGRIAAKVEQARGQRRPHHIHWHTGRRSLKPEVDCDSTDGHNELRAKAQSLCAGSG